MFEAETWVALAFVVFIAVLAFFGVSRRIPRGTEGPRAGIRGDLEGARRLKEEARALLAEYQRKQHAADEEAAAILASARAEAERLAADARAKAEEFLT